MPVCYKFGVEETPRRCPLKKFLGALKAETIDPRETPAPPLDPSLFLGKTKPPIDKKHFINRWF